MQISCEGAQVDQLASFEYGSSMSARRPPVTTAAVTDAGHDSIQVPVILWSPFAREWRWSGNGGAWAKGAGTRRSALLP